MSSHYTIDRRTLLCLLDGISRRVEKQGRPLEIALYGGAALLLSPPIRKTTRDIDFVPLLGCPEEVIEIADAVAQDLCLPRRLFSEDVEVFVSPRAEYQPPIALGGRNALTVRVPTPQYLLAMKMLAMRSPDGCQDSLDAWRLMDACGVRSLGDAERLAEHFYPRKPMSQRECAIVRDMLSAKASGCPYSPALAW